MVMYEIFTVGELKFELTKYIDASGSVIFKYFLRTHSLYEVVSDQAKNNKRDNNRKKTKKTKEYSDKVLGSQNRSQRKLLPDILYSVNNACFCHGVFTYYCLCMSSVE